MKEDGKSKEKIVSRKESPDGSEGLYPDFDAEAAEARRMKEECDSMSKEMLEKIDVLLTKIDSILKADTMGEENVLFPALLERLISTGLSIEQAQEYICYFQKWNASDMNSGKPNVEDILPRDEYLNTLAEAQRIVKESSMNKANPRTLHPVQMRHYLSVPDSQWKNAKKLIASFFHATELMVNALYNSDEAWLLKTPEECLDAAHYTNYICGNDSQLSWKVFMHTGLLGREETEKRVNQLYELLGEEDCTKLIKVDAETGNWLFYRQVVGNPVECIAYLKQCDLSNKRIIAFVAHYGYVLYLFNKPGMLRRIDSIIERFLPEFQWNYGPCYEGLSQEEIYFLIHGHGKLKG